MTALTQSRATGPLDMDMPREDYDEDDDDGIPPEAADGTNAQSANGATTLPNVCGANIATRT